jgi:uncharacterized protein (TIGR03382 family)
VITLPDTIECNQTNAASVTLDGTGSMPSGDLHFFGWSVNGGPTLAGATVSATLALGADDVALTVFNSAFGVGLAEKHVTVVDTTPPTIQPVAPVTDTVCDPASQSATIAAPIATDVCSPTVMVTGAVVAVNGVTLGTPIPIQNGSVQLPSGVSVVLWTATDQSGNVSTITQTLTVRPGIESSDSIVVGEGSSVVLPNAAGFAMIGNTGARSVVLRNQAQTASVLSQGAIDLEGHAVVHGDALSARSIHNSGAATVTGTISANATVSLPAGRDLSGVVFPTSNNGPVAVGAHQMVTLAPGAYSRVSVDAAGTLVLSAGTYFFETLDLEGDSRLNLDQSSGGVSLYVHTSMSYAGQIASIAGNAGDFVLGYAGSQPLDVQTRFLAGTLIAPSALVTISSLDPNGFIGELFAKRIELKEHGTMVCDPIGLSAQQAGLPLTDDDENTGQTSAALQAGPLSAPTPAPRSGGCSSASASFGGPSAALLAGFVVSAAVLRRRKRRVATSRAAA